MLLNQSIITDIKSIITQTQDNAVLAVDHQRTLMYWHIGKRNFEEEFEGKDLADYGKYLTVYIAIELEPEFRSGFSKRQIELVRQFYRTFSITNTLNSQLSWSQHKLYLPTEQQLLNEVNKELESFEEKGDNDKPSAK